MTSLSALWLGKAFELRQRADYREQVETVQEQMTSILEQADRFVRAVSNHLVAAGKI